MGWKASMQTICYPRNDVISVFKLEGQNSKRKCTSPSITQTRMGQHKQLATLCGAVVNMQDGLLQVCTAL